MSYHFGHYFQCFISRPLEHEDRGSLHRAAVCPSFSVCRVFSCVWFHMGKLATHSIRGGGEVCPGWYQESLCLILV